MESSRPDEAYRPDPRFADPQILSEALTSGILPLVLRPGRYIGGELGARREAWREDRANIVLGFPDAYEIGMSHTGLRVLYSLLRDQSPAYADLVFAPWPDMEDRMRAAGLPLFALQTRRPAAQFDVLAFSVCYELGLTNLLTMLDLAGLPLLAARRQEDHPVVIAGGACTLNPHVLAPFIDVQFLGDGEDTILEIAAAVQEVKSAGGGRAELCDRLAAIGGAWRPGQGPVRSRVLPDLNRYAPPDDLVPVIEPVHDRLSLEIMRGCARGCRFCQAGMVTRPVRERDAKPLLEAATSSTGRAGWNEVSLLSLSAADYSALPQLIAVLTDRLRGTHTNLVLPSLRVDSLREDLTMQISQEAPGGFTFAPEAGSQRLRDVINKQVTEQDILGAAGRAFAAGAKSIKLYFMIGLPTETDEDLEAIITLVERIVGAAPRGPSQVTVSVSPFAPKPHTPFQWAGQIPRAEIARRNQLLGRQLQKLRVKVSLRDPSVSQLEALLGLGDERTARAVQLAWRLGARFDAWDEFFDWDRWERALAGCGIEPEAELGPRDPAAVLPWDDIVAAVDREFLASDWQRAQQGLTLSDCRLSGECYDCAACNAELEHRFAVAGSRTAAEEGAGRSERPPALDPGMVDAGSAPGERPDRWETWRRQAASKCWYRAEYAKEGDLCFLGHLDFQRQFQLALRRSRLPLAYSQGYHPHPLIKFGPPLPVGVAGRCESLDLALLWDVPDWPEQLGESLPSGMRILRSLTVGAAAPRAIDKCADRMDYRIELGGHGSGSRGDEDPGPIGSSAWPTLLAERVSCFLAAGSWPVVRQRPQGAVEIDARALVAGEGLFWEALPAARIPGGPAPVLRLSLVRTDRSGSLPIHEFLAVLFGEALPEPRTCRIERLGLCGRSPTGHWLTPFEEVGEAKRRFWLATHLYA